MRGQKRIEGMFDALNAARAGAFIEKREAIRLFDPSFDRADPQGRIGGDFNAVQDSMYPHTSIGQISLTNIRVATINAIFPVDEAWYDYEQIPSIQEIIESQSSAQERALVRDGLDRIARLVHRRILASGKDDESPTGWSPGIHQHKIGVIDQLFIMGGVLEHFDPSTMLFRRYPMSNYVTRRNKYGQPIMHIIRELDDPRGLPSQVPVPIEFLKSDRGVYVYTGITWDEGAKTWVLEQEANGEVFNTVDLGRHSPYFETVFKLPHGRDTPIGYLETLTRTMRSLDAMEARISQLIDIAANKRPAVGTGTSVPDDEFLEAPGKVLRGLDVGGGKVLNAAWFGADAIPEIAAVRSIIMDRQQVIAEATLNGPQTIRDSERTTGEEIRSVNIPRLNNILGGALGPIVEQQHRPMIAAILREISKSARRDSSDPLVNALANGADSVGIMVGAAGIRRANELERTRAFLQDSAVAMQIAASQGQVPGMATRFDVDGAIRRLAALYSIDDDGLFKSEQQVLEEQEAQERAMDAANASEAAARAVGQIAVNQAVPA